MKKEPQVPFRVSSLNTLVQTETAELSCITKKPPIIVSGRGSDLGSERTVKGRAKRKMITEKLIYTFITLAEKKEEVEKLNSYWNTYHCQRRVFTANGKQYGRYCKNRFCTICCSIRKAYIINRYLPAISLWPNPHFVTLTAKSVRAKNLPGRMKDMNRGFRIISSRCRKRAQRGRGVKLIGIKSLECNFNPTKKTYNPHLHLIVATKEMAEIIVAEWLQLCTYKFARLAAQDVQEVNDKEKALMEIVKYGSKIFTEPGATEKKESIREVFVAALDNIFTSMKGIRIFERFGFDLPKSTDAQKQTCRVLTDYQEWQYHPESMDWLNGDHESTLTSYVAPAELINLLQYNIDTSLE